MRTLKLQIQLSLDGFVAGPRGEMDWMTWNWDDALNQFVSEIHQTVDCMIMSPIFAEGFIPHWDKVAENPEDPEREFAKLIQQTQKVIFAKQDDIKPDNISDWKHTSWQKEDSVNQLKSLKEEEGGDIIVYGDPSFVGELIKEALIDKYQLFINPTAIGEGISIFNQFEGYKQLRLEDAKKFDCGITVLTYLKN